MSKPLKLFLFAAALALAAPGAMADGMAQPPYGNAPAQYGPAASRGSPSYGETIGTKLGAGASSLILSPLEIPKNIINTSNEVNLALGLTGGVAKGFLHMAGRLLTGLVDVLTFAIPTQPIASPQFIWENFSTETRYGSMFRPKP